MTNIIKSGATNESGKQLPIDRDELNSAVMGGSVVGFLDGMTKRNKRIVKNTYAYADLVSKIKYPHPDQKEQRYDNFRNLMLSQGWVECYNAFNQYHSSATSLKMDNVALDIVSSALGGAAGAAGGALKVVAGKTIEALKQTPDAIKLFDTHAKHAKGANFGVSVCKQDSEGSVTLAVGTVHYESSVNDTSVAFFEWDSSNAEIYQGKAIFVIDEDDLANEEECVMFLKEFKRDIFLEFSRK